MRERLASSRARSIPKRLAGQEIYGCKDSYIGKFRVSFRDSLKTGNRINERSVSLVGDPKFQDVSSILERSHCNLSDVCRVGRHMNHTYFRTTFLGESRHSIKMKFAGNVVT